MDFTRFMDLLESRSLWFTRLDQLEDPLEGTHTDAELAGIRGHLPQKRANEIIRVFRQAKRGLYVNCWRSGKAESLAMWDLYGKGSGNIAIKSTVGLLKSAVKRYHQPLYISKVGYLDWSGASGLDNVLVACSRKDLSYQHESEVRLIVMDTSSHPRKTPELGLRMAVELEDLVTEIVVGPREPKWVVQLIKNLLSKHELTQPVVQSDRLTPRD